MSGSILVGATGNTSVANTSDVTAGMGLSYTVTDTVNGYGTGFSDVDFAALNDWSETDGIVSLGTSSYAKFSGEANLPSCVLNLEQPSLISDFILYGSKDKDFTYCAFEYSVDGINWSPIENINVTVYAAADNTTFYAKGNHLVRRQLVTPVVARYIRVTIGTGKYNIDIAELCVFGEEVGAAKLESVTPNSGAKDVSIDSNVVFNFAGTPLDTESYIAVTFVRDDNSTVKCSASITENSVTVVPSTNLMAGASYTVTLSGLVDILGNTVEIDPVSFTTHNTSDVTTGMGLSYTVTDTVNGYGTGFSDVDFAALNDWSETDGIVSLGTSSYAKFSGEANLPSCVLNLEQPSLISDFILYGSKDKDFTYCAFEYSVDGINWSPIENINVTVYAAADNTTFYAKGNHLVRRQLVTPVVARYIRVTIGTGRYNIDIAELCVFGRPLCESDMPCVVVNADYDETTSTAVAKVAFCNPDSEEVDDKLYLFAVYVDEVLYKIDKADQSTAKIGANAVGNTAILEVTLPEGTSAERVTGRIFVWSDIETIVPVTSPFDVL